MFASFLGPALKTLPQTCHVLINICRMNERVTFGGWNVGGLLRGQVSYRWELWGFLPHPRLPHPLSSLPSVFQLHSP